MPVRKQQRTYRPAEEFVPPAEAAMEDEPMRHWPHPIAAAPASCGCEAKPAGDLGQVLEQLACQNQLLVDLLGAVNSLTAALLCREERH